MKANQRGERGSKMGSPSSEKKVDPGSSPTAFKLFGALFPISLSISDIPTLLQDAREGNGNPTNYGNEERGLCYGANEHGRGERVGVEATTNAIMFGKVEEIVEESIAKKGRVNRVFACPRCDSMETKFCYYNNYNMNQPRHFCKICQRYWTAGGTLRNIPIGSGRRRNKNQNQPQNRLQNHSQATSVDVGGPSQRDISDVAFVSSGLAISSTGLKRGLPLLAGPTHTPPSRYGVAPLHRYSYGESHAKVLEVSEMFMEDSSMCGSSLTAQQDVMNEKDAADSELKSAGATSQGKTFLDASLGQRQFRCGTIAWNQVNGDLQTNMPWSKHVQVPMWWHPNLGWGGATFVPKMVELDVCTPILCKHTTKDPPFMTNYSDTEPIGTTKSLKIDDPMEVARSSIWAQYTHNCINHGNTQSFPTQAILKEDRRPFYSILPHQPCYIE